MGFSIKTQAERTASMLLWFLGIQTKVTDTQVGSITRSKIESVATELEEMDFEFFIALKKAIPTSIYRAFEFNLISAAKASGDITFHADVAPIADIDIPKGTRVATVGTPTAPEVVYETTVDATLAIAQNDVDVQVAALEAGPEGNTAATTITVMKSAVSGIDSISNALEFSNGAVAETEDERRQRFLEYISTLTRGTSTALEYAAKLAVILDGNGNIQELIIQAKEFTNTTPHAGFSEVYIYNGSGSTSAEIITEAQKIIDGFEEGGVKVSGYKAAGVTANVYAAPEIAQGVTMTLVLLDGYDEATIIAQVETAISGYIAGLGIGDSLIFNEIIELAMSIKGVYNCTLTAPSADVSPEDIGAAVFDGAGLDDLTEGGAYSGSDTTLYQIEVDATGGTDTFKWGKTNDSGLVKDYDATGVSMTGAAQALDNGVTITFTATTGHTLGDKWTVKASALGVIVAGTIDVTVP